MKFKLHIILIIVMLLVGLIYGTIFHYFIMPFFAFELVHCIFMGLIFGFINYLASILIYIKFDKLKKSHKILQKNIHIDKLTGLYNRRFFDIFTKNLNDNQTFSIVFIDIDDFGKFNKKFGHTIGDIVLQKTSNTIVANIRSIDKAFRYGGEEFIIILMDCEKKNAVKIADKIRVSVSSIDNMPYHPITISLGVASYPEDDSQVKKVIEASDKALRIAKRSGKNCTVEGYVSNFVYSPKRI